MAGILLTHIKKKLLSGLLVQIKQLLTETQSDLHFHSISNNQYLGCTFMKRDIDVQKFFGFF